MSIEIIAGIGIPLIAFLWGIWWRVESRQDQNIKDFKLSNQQEHEMLRQDMKKNTEELSRQHMALRDKIQDIWEHLVKRKD